MKKNNDNSNIKFIVLITYNNAYLNKARIYKETKNKSYLKQ